MIDTNHAILADGMLLMIADKRWKKVDVAREQCWPVGEVMRLALAHKLTHVWVMPGIEVDYTHDASVWNLRTYKREVYTREAEDGNQWPEKIFFSNGWEQPHGKEVKVIMVARTAWYGKDTGNERDRGWMYGAGLCDILQAINYLEMALGVPFGPSPSGMGWRLLHVKNEHTPRWLAPVQDFDLRKNHFDPRSTRELIVRRMLSPEELSMGYIHKFDKNMAYPYAASFDCNIGVGTPIQSRDPEQDFQDKKVGVWKVELTAPAAQSSHFLYPLWDVKGRRDWIAGPIIRLLRARGYTVRLVDAWVFPEQHAVMDAWAKMMWDTRQAFSVPHAIYRNDRSRELARTATKEIAVASIGVTNYKGFTALDTSEKNRVDIRTQIVARHFELMCHNVFKFEELYKTTPTIAYMDALYYVSDEPDGARAFPEIVKRSEKFGGFKYEGRLAINDEVKAILARPLQRGDRTGGANILEDLNKIGWEK